jgi:hypothetical protein
MKKSRIEQRLGFKPKKLKISIISKSPRVLSGLAKNDSKFVRARVAGNVHINEQTHLRLLQDPERGVVLWALKNAIINRRHIDLVIENNPSYCPVITPALAVHSLVTPEEKEKFLLMIEEYKAKMCYK